MQVPRGARALIRTHPGEGFVLSAAPAAPHSLHSTELFMTLPAPTPPPALSLYLPASPLVLGTPWGVGVLWGEGSRTEVSASRNKKSGCGAS